MNADAVAALREALSAIQDICKPMSFDMSGKAIWFEGNTPAGGGSRQRIWELCEAALAAAPLPEPVYDFAWLIERGQPEGQVPTVWWWLAAGGREGWTEVATEAFHFESREAAEEIIAAKFTPPTSRGEASARAVEHGFRRATPLPSDTPADGLDVERLTRALWVVEFEAEEGPYEHASEANVIDVTGLAEAIAREYAALALTQEPRSGDDR